MSGDDATEPRFPEVTSAEHRPREVVPPATATPPTTAGRSVRPRSLPSPTRREAFGVWTRIGLLSFGGPAAQIALMHRYLVEERRWLDERGFLSALSFCMLLPGPEAMQLATYAGWRLHGTLGGLVAGLMFVLPGAIIVLALAALYATLGGTGLVETLFFGVRAAVLVIVVQALARVAGRALTTTAHRLLAAFAFVALFFLALPYPLVIAAAALAGFFLQREGGRQRGAKGGSDVTASAAEPERPSNGANVPTPVPKVAVTTGAGNAEDAENGAAITGTSTTATSGTSTALRRTLGTVALWLGVWWLPILALDAVVAPDILGELARFFSTLAVVTFGGAYAVLAYLAQDVVARFGWLTSAEVLDALALAETTPGPLILVTEFVGFLAAFRADGLWTGLAGAAVTLWVTFVPCFLWIFAGAPYLDALSAKPRLRGALDAITAAVVGVMLNLSLWFALHVLFARVEAREIGPLTLWTPEWTTLDWRAALLGTVCAVLVFRLRWDVPRLLAFAAVVGVALRTI